MPFKAAEDVSLTKRLGTYLLILCRYRYGVCTQGTAALCGLCFVSKPEEPGKSSTCKGFMGDPFFPTAAHSAGLTASEAPVPTDFLYDTELLEKHTRYGSLHVIVLPRPLFTQVYISNVIDSIVTKF